MKILVVGSVRTRSSFLLDILCRHYNVTNYFECYNQPKVENESKTFFKSKNVLFESYKNRIKLFTEELHKKDNFGCKFFPLMGLNYYKISGKNGDAYSSSQDWTIQSEDVMDLNEYFYVNKFDKIYISYRSNFTDVVASYLYGKQLQNQLATMDYSKGMLFKKNEIDIANSLKPKGKLNYNYINVKALVRDQLILDAVPHYLEKHNIDYTKLEYAEIPAFCSNNFPDVISEYHDTNYNYSKMLSNYLALHSDVIKAKQELEEIIDLSKLFSK